MTPHLLDTHAFLWFIFDDPRLSSAAAKVIADTNVTKYLSIVSLCEMVIKTQLGKLKLGMELETFFAQYVTGSELTLLDIGLDHLLTYGTLSLAHRDPFDRLLIAQARTMNIPIVSADPLFSQYELKVVW